MEREIESMIGDLERARAPDGYLNCWYLEREPENRWTNERDNHELYNAGHQLEGALAYLQVTGRDRFLGIMERFVDHIATVFGPREGQKHGYPGHQEAELALVRAWHATGQRKHLDLATYFIDERGSAARGEHFFDAEARAARARPATGLRTTSTASRTGPCASRPRSWATPFAPCTCTRSWPTSPRSTATPR